MKKRSTEKVNPAPPSVEVLQGLEKKYLTKVGQAAERPPDTFLIKEYASSLGISDEAARKKLTRMVKAGMLRKVKMTTMDVTNRLIPITGFQIVKDGEAQAQ